MRRALSGMIACAALCVALAGCSTSGLIRTNHNELSGMALGEHVVKLSDSQNITEVKLSANDLSGSETVWTDADRHIREVVRSNGAVVSLEYHSDLYLRPYAAFGTHRQLPSTRHGCFDVLHFSSEPRFSASLLPRAVEIYRVSGHTVFFRTAAHGDTLAAFPGAPKRTERSAIRIEPEHGYFRFNAGDLATYAVIQTYNGSGSKLLGFSAISYPQAIPAGVAGKPPGNICKR